MKFSGHCLEVQKFCLRFSETEYNYYFTPSFCWLAHCSLLIHVKLDPFKAFFVNSGIFTGAAPGKACVTVRRLGWDHHLLTGASAVHPSCSGSPGHTRQPTLLRSSHQTSGPVGADTGHLPGAAGAEEALRVPSASAPTLSVAQSRDGVEMPLGHVHQ